MNNPANKVNIVYVGPKESKRDTITGSRLIFPRLKPVPVEYDVAYMLTKFKGVWVFESDLTEFLDQAGQLAEKKAQAIAAKEAEAAAAIIAMDMRVTLGEQEYDLSKLNSVKIATLIESHDLDIEPKGSHENVEAFRVRVRDAIRG